MIKKFTNKVKNPFHRRKLGIEDQFSSASHGSTVSLNDNISKNATPPAVPNQSQDTLLSPRAASLHSSAPSRVDTANEAPEPSQLAKAGSVAWKGLETALRLLESSAGAFPPLKLAVSGLVACLDLAQVNYCFGFDLLDAFFEVDLRQSSTTVKSMKA